MSYFNFTDPVNADHENALEEMASFEAIQNHFGQEFSPFEDGDDDDDNDVPTRQLY